MVQLDHNRDSFTIPSKEARISSMITMTLLLDRFFLHAIYIQRKTPHQTTIQVKKISATHPPAPFFRTPFLIHIQTIRLLWTRSTSSCSSCLGPDLDHQRSCPSPCGEAQERLHGGCSSCPDPGPDLDPDLRSCPCLCDAARETLHDGCCSSFLGLGLDPDRRSCPCPCGEAQGCEYGDQPSERHPPLGKAQLDERCSSCLGPDLDHQRSCPCPCGVAQERLHDGCCSSFLGLDPDPDRRSCPCPCDGALGHECEGQPSEHRPPPVKVQPGGRCSSCPDLGPDQRSCPCPCGGVLVRPRGPCCSSCPGLGPDRRSCLSPCGEGRGSRGRSRLPPRQRRAGSSCPDLGLDRRSCPCPCDGAGGHECEGRPSEHHRPLHRLLDERCSSFRHRCPCPCLGGEAHEPQHHGWQEQRQGLKLEQVHFPSIDMSDSLLLRLI
jgi:hypothetical protein